MTEQASTFRIPEIGPLLGRVAAPVGATTSVVPLDDVRLALATELFELAGNARAFSAAGDIDFAVQTLSRQGWLAAWERAVAAAASRVVARLEARIAAAAAESRLPARHRRRVKVTPEERRGIAVRLGAGGGTLIEALDRLEAEMRRAVRESGDDRSWIDALRLVARRMEHAWLCLEEAAVEEEAAWQRDVTDIRQWRRPRWMLWLLTLLVVSILLYLGLALGGFLPVPAPLRPVADWWWSVE